MTAAEGFAAIPNWMIRDGRFDIYDIAVYVALASHTGPGGVRPSQATLAAEARCSERQVRTVIQRLVEHGVVEVTRRRRTGAGTGRNGALTNGYVLHPHGNLADDEEPAPYAGTSDQPAHHDRPTGTAAQITPLIEEEPVEEESSSEVAVATIRPDVIRLLDLLDAEIVRNGGKEPRRTKKNLDAARLLLDRDGKTVEQVEAAIRWCQADEFWRSNILSMSKLRERYEQLRLQASRGYVRGAAPMQRAQGVLDMGRRLQEQASRAGVLS